MFGGHTRRLTATTDTKKSDFKNGEWWMDLFVAVGVLFAIGYAAGFGFRSLTAHMRDQRSPYRPTSSLRDFDYREDPVWTR